MRKSLITNFFSLLIYKKFIFIRSDVSDHFFIKRGTKKIGPSDWNGCSISLQKEVGLFNFVIPN